MKDVSILVPETVIIDAVADSNYLFSAVNQIILISGKSPLLNIHLLV